MSGNIVTIEGLDQFNAFIASIEPKLNSLFFKLGNEYANLMHSTMRSVVPVLSGYLKSTIGKSSTTTEIMVYVDASYAGYVNFGTRKMKAQPYFTSTVQQLLPQFEQAFDAESGKVLSGSGG